MPAASPGYVKNIIRRCFREVVIAKPNRQQQAKIWRHFRWRCAYCGQKLSKARREGHLDHLVAASAGGSNTIGNLVLSCGPCNSKEKLDKSWEEFLAQKAAEPEELDIRRCRILEWQAINPSPCNEIANCIRTADVLAQRTITELDTNLQTLKAYTKSGASSMEDVRKSNEKNLVVTRELVAEKFTTYLQGELSLEALVGWSERAFQEAEFDPSDSEPIAQAIARLGLADATNFTLTWEDCTQILGLLGYRVSVKLYPL